MIFDDSALASLKSMMKRRLSEKRYLHTLGVERMARHLGKILLPDRLGELSAAALLHDIVKEMSTEEHLKLLEGLSEYTEEDIATIPALHSFAAVQYVKRELPQYATNDILSAIKNHTLGAPGMSVFDEIIFISDYAEDGRTYPICVEVNRYLKDNIKPDKSFEENMVSLHKASLKATDSTVSSLTQRKALVNSRTLSTKKYLEQITKNSI